MAISKFIEYRTTNNRSVFNKLHKNLHSGCSCCGWHGQWSENDTWPWYAVYLTDVEVKRSRYYSGNFTKRAGEGTFPNWKLVSKNPKQWMEKPTRIEKRWSDYNQAYSELGYIKWDIKKW